MYRLLSAVVHRSFQSRYFFIWRFIFPNSCSVNKSRGNWLMKSKDLVLIVRYVTIPITWSSLSRFSVKSENLRSCVSIWVANRVGSSFICDVIWLEKCTFTTFLKALKTRLSMASILTMFSDSFLSWCDSVDLGDSSLSLGSRYELPLLGHGLDTILPFLVVGEGLLGVDQVSTINSCNLWGFFLTLVDLLGCCVRPQYCLVPI